MNFGIVNKERQFDCGRLKGAFIPFLERELWRWYQQKKKRYKTSRNNSNLYLNTDLLLHVNELMCKTDDAAYLSIGFYLRIAYACVQQRCHNSTAGHSILETVLIKEKYQVFLHHQLTVDFHIFFCCDISLEVAMILLLYGANLASAHQIICGSSKTPSRRFFSVGYIISH